MSKIVKKAVKVLLIRYNAELNKSLKTIVIFINVRIISLNPF